MIGRDYANRDRNLTRENWPCPDEEEMENETMSETEPILPAEARSPGTQNSAGIFKAQRDALSTIHAIAGLCPNCGRTLEADLVDDTVTVGAVKRTETVPLRYCKACRDSFAQSFRKAA
jgi:hypothetical protein